MVWTNPLLGALNAATTSVPTSVGLIYWFYVEGVGFSIAMLLFYHIFVRGGRPFYNQLAEKIDSAIIDNFFHRYIPRAVESTYTKLFQKFETGVIDEGYNKKLVDLILGLGRRFARVQTGKINHYLVAFLLGLIFFMALLLGMIL